MRECFKRGLYIRSLTHDLSKFRPSEFFPYAIFFDEKKKPQKTDFVVKDNFRRAVCKHYNRNDHHWQYWYNIFESGYELFSIPEKVRLEMVCDWIGASKAQKVMDNRKEPLKRMVEQT